MARLVVAAVVGIAVGYVTGDVGLGIKAGALVYGFTGFLDPAKKLFGPRLQDLKAPQANYGAAIPYVVGAPRLAGVFIWSSKKREIAAMAQQGKGGPGVNSTTYTYEIDVLIEVADNACAGIRRVWSNGALKWSNANDASVATLVAAAGTPLWRRIAFYDGNANQLPDATYEAAVGIGNAPAYRGRSTVFIEGLNLGNSGQLPVLTFEVCSSGSIASTYGPFADVPCNGWQVGQGSSPFSPLGFNVHIGQWDGSRSNSNVVVYAVAPDGSATQLSTYTAAFTQPSGHGQTDIDGIMSGQGENIYWNEGELGRPYHFILPGTDDFGAGGQIRFCMLGDMVVFGSQLVGSKKLYRYRKSGASTPEATSSALPYYVQALATDGSSIYALDSLTTRITVLDAATLTVQSTITAPGTTTTGNGFILVDEFGTLLYGVDASGLPPYGNAISAWDGTAWTVRYPSAFLGLVVGDAQFGVSEGVVFEMAVGNFPGETHTGVQRIHGFFGTLNSAVVPLSQVVSDLLLRTGQLQASDFDVTALASQNVRAMVISQVGPTRATIDLLMGAYFFEWSEGQKLVAVRRGGAPALTIPYTDLAASADGKAEPLPRKRLNDIEVAAQVTVKFGNVANDFQDGAEQADRLITESTAQSVVDLPLGLTPLEAKQIADGLTMDLAVGLEQIGPIALTRKYSAIQATDVLILTGADGGTYRTRVTKRTFASGVVSCELAMDDASAVASTSTTDGNYSESTVLVPIPQTLAEYLDIPILRDADNDAGFYVDAKGTGPSWPGAQLFSSRDDVTYASETTIADQGIFGFCTSTLGDWTNGRVFDELNSVTVNVGSGVLSSSTRSALLADQSVNAFAIGLEDPVRWELGQFRTAAYISPGVYTLSGLLRGSRGTEWAQTGHVSNEVFVLLTSSGMRRVGLETTLVGMGRFYKAATQSRTLPQTRTDDFIDTGVGLKPFSPFDLRRTRSSGDITMTWRRRTRLAVRMAGPLGVSVPLGEQSEAYSVDIFTDGTYATIARTLSASTPSAVYTSAQQTADFGSPQPTVYVKVYQLSAIVGRGYELKAAA